MGRNSWKRDEEGNSMKDDSGMKVLHGRSTQDDKDSHPKRNTLERNGFIDHFFQLLFIFLSGRFILKNDGIQEDREDSKHQKQFNEKHREILGMMRDAFPRLHDHPLTHIMKVRPSRKEDDDQQNAHNLFILLIEGLGTGPDIFLGDCGFESGSHGHHQKGQPANPDDGGKQVQPMDLNRNELIEVSQNPEQG